MNHLDIFDYNGTNYDRIYLIKYLLHFFGTDSVKICGTLNSIKFIEIEYKKCKIAFTDLQSLTGQGKLSAACKIFNPEEF